MAPELDLVFCAVESDRDEFVSAELQPQLAAWRYITTGVPAAVLVLLLNFLSSWLFHLRQTESPFYLKPSVVLFSVGLAFGRVLQRECRRSCRWWACPTILCWQVILGLSVALCPILFSPYTTDSPKYNSLQSIHLCCGMSAVEGKCCSLLCDSSVIPCNKDVTATLSFFFFFFLF